jgi:hypothetical protein
MFFAIGQKDSFTIDSLLTPEPSAELAELVISRNNL